MEFLGNFNFFGNVITFIIIRHHLGSCLPLVNVSGIEILLLERKKSVGNTKYVGNGTTFFNIFFSTCPCAVSSCFLFFTGNVSFYFSIKLSTFLIFSQCCTFPILDQVKKKISLPCFVFCKSIFNLESMRTPLHTRCCVLIRKQMGTFFRDQVNAFIVNCKFDLLVSHRT